MDLKSIMAVMGLLWHRGRSVAVPPHSIYPVAPAAGDAGAITPLDGATPTA